LKLEHLSDDQLIALAEYRDRWQRIVLETGACDREQAERWICELYRLAGQPEPKAVLWTQSPRQLSRMYGGLRDGGAATGAGTPPRPLVRLMVQEPVDVVRADVRRRVGFAVWSRIWAATRGSVGERVRSLLEGELRGDVRMMGFGAHDGDWLGAYAFLLEECSFGLARGLAPLMELARHCGWWLPLREVALASERPAEIHVADGRLHCDGGPALRFRDGTCYWCLEGVEVRRRVAETPATEFPVEWWEREQNAAVRQVIQRKIGLEDLEMVSQSVILDRAVVTIAGVRHPYALLAIHSHRRPRKALQMLNPSTGETHHERVPPQVETARQALAWRNGTEEMPGTLT